MKAFIFLLFILKVFANFYQNYLFSEFCTFKIFVSSEEDTGMVPPDGSDVALDEEGIDNEELIGGKKKIRF